VQQVAEIVSRNLHTRIVAPRGDPFTFAATPLAVGLSTWAGLVVSRSGRRVHPAFRGGR
jgi:hypothetical protein